MANFADYRNAVDEALSEGVHRGVMHSHADDHVLDGRCIGVDGQKLINFGSCSYLGLEVHPALKRGAIRAAQRYGTQFSSSRAYISAPPYREAESLLTTLFRRPTILTASTTLGHLAALPTVVGDGDALLLDHQVHSSVQMAARQVQSQGNTVDLIRHNDMEGLEQRIVELTRGHRKVWFAADGLYSMFADFAELRAVERLMTRYPNLWLYVDDAHSVSWTGQNGRGYALEMLGARALERTIVAASLNKSFAAAGGVLTFPTEELRRRVFTVGGPMIFSGPVQPPMLGAITASVRLHLQPEIADRQAHLVRLIRLFNKAAEEAQLPLVSPSEAPIRCIGAGVPSIAYNLTSRLRRAGCFVDTAVFPAVSAKRCGARVTLTAHHTEADVEKIVTALAEELPHALREEGSSFTELAETFARQLKDRVNTLPVDGHQPARARLSIEHHRSISTMDAAEWDHLFRGRGAMESSGLLTLESTFGQTVTPGRDAWRFDYWVVRDEDRHPIAATFFTTALWKDDMLASAQLSAEVERARQQDPSYLTSVVVGMGSLLTEGDHLYLDRGSDWRRALRLILSAARELESAVGANSVALRDLASDDAELHEFLLGEGFIRLPAPVSWVREIDFDTDDEFLAALTSRSRRHQRVNVLAREKEYQIRVVTSQSGEKLTARELDHLYGLYRNVHARNLELNVFPLPRRLLDDIAQSPGWEIMTLVLPGGPNDPVAFVAQHVGQKHLQPLFLGLNYDYVASHGSYQQVLWQTIRSGQRHRIKRILLGMSADRHKGRFGAQPERRRVYMQSLDSYNADELARVAQSMGVAG